MKFASTLSFLILILQLNAQTNCANLSTQILGTSCEGANDGIINIIVSEGIPPYSFIWQDENGSTLEGQCISNIPAGIYYLSVEDTNNTISEPILVEIG